MSEYIPAIEVLHEEFEIPQLEKKRRVSVLLPYDYDSTEKKYPVLYLQDGQNLFNPHAPYGNWAIDEALAKMARKGRHELIIVAVDHGEEDRITEYLPFEDHPRFGEGDGSKYVDFLVNDLIPYVNEKYRTLPEAEHTGIGGSSMGGLISLFAGITRPEVFGKMLIFSPSLWISGKIYQLADQFDPKGNRIYVYAGGRESRHHLRNVRAMVEILRYKPNLKIKFSVRLWARHSEYYWRQEFPKAVKWLYFKDKQ